MSRDRFGTADQPASVVDELRRPAARRGGRLGAARHAPSGDAGRRRGSGKTRLACEVAAGKSASFPDGVWFVALDSTTTGDGVAATVAGALGLSMSDTAGQPELAAVSSLDRIRGALADRRTLVVLDNCEHVIDAAAQLAVELLSSAPGVRMLATSREALRVPGEMVWTVPPLDTDDAVTLFTERARAASADFDVSESVRGVARRSVRPPRRDAVGDRAHGRPQ